MKYSMFIGRWQPWHDGHRWLIDQRLNEGKNVLICVREVSQDDKNRMIEAGIDKEKITIIPHGVDCNNFASITYC